METTRFIAANGREAIEIVTDSGVSGYVDASIPLDAIAAWRRRLGAYLRHPIAHSRRLLRQDRRRVFRQVRRCAFCDESGRSSLR